MKKLVLSSAPVWATFGYYKGINDDKNIHYYDDSEYAAYCRKLEADFDKKYTDPKTNYS